MFVLALTILAVSLFSLSGYEAQFLTGSRDESRAFYDAMGGIERTKYVLAATNSLAEAQLNLPTGIAYASATQNGDSTGSIDWSDTSATGVVRIHVIARDGSHSRELQADYEPSSARTLYRDILATTGAIAVSQDAAQRGSIHVYGSIRTNSADESGWINDLPGDFTVRSGGVPSPEAQDFVNAWGPQATGAPDFVRVSGSVHSYGFPLGADSTRVFYGTPAGAGASADSAFGLDDTHSGDITFDVSGTGGTAVWLLPQGAHFEQPVTVTGSGNHRLVIVAVAQPGSGKVNSTYADVTHANLGLWFQGGLRSQAVKVFLISNGVVALDRLNGRTHSDWNLDYLAVLAGGIYLMGPNGGRRMQFNHTGDDAQILDPLYDQGLLPNTLGRTRTFALIPGSWKDLSRVPNGH